MNARRRQVLLLASAACWLSCCGGRPLPASGDGAAAGQDGASSPGSDAVCRARYSVQPPVPFACGQVGYPGGSLALDGGKLVYTARQTLGSNSGADLDLFRRDTKTGQVEQLTMDELETELLAAAEGELLFLNRKQPGSSAYLYYRTKVQVVGLGTDVAQMGGVHGLYSARPARLISQGTVVWRGADVLHLRDAVSSKVIASNLGNHYAELDNQGGRVVWSVWDGVDREIYLYRDGSVSQLTQNQTDDHAPQLDGDAVLWICGDAICRWRGGATEQLDHGECTDLVVRQGQAAWICDGQVMLHDGSAARAVAGSRGDTSSVREGLRLDGGRLLWLEAPATFGFDSRGKVYFSDGEQTVLVAEVGLPCIYCDMYWPPLQLALEGDVVAWSYYTAGSPPSPSSDCAYTTIDRRLDCER